MKEGLLISCTPNDGYVIGATIAQGVILLTGDPNEGDLVDDDRIAYIVAVDDGTTYKYGSVIGAQKTVHAYHYLSGK